MTRRWNVIIQILATLAQMGNVWGVFWPKHEVQIAAVLAIVQAVTAILAHNVNPDGTPAISPYVPPQTIGTIKPPVQRILLLLAVLPLLAGCAGMADVVRALGQDPATICATAVTSQGTIRIARTAIPNGKVTCTPDGMTVESQINNPSLAK